MKYVIIVSIVVSLIYDAFNVVAIATECLSGVAVFVIMQITSLVYDLFFVDPDWSLNKIGTMLYTLEIVVTILYAYLLMNKVSEDETQSHEDGEFVWIFCLR